MKLQTVVFLILSALSSTAQPYVSGGNTSHRFAQMNLGLDWQGFMPAGTKTFILDTQGNPKPARMNSQFSSRLIIGGTHFWGHADFYISIPVTSFGKSGFAPGIETGTRLFPWRIEHHKLRPYMGVSWLTTSFQQGVGVEQHRNTFPLTGGLVYNHGNHLIELGTGWISGSTFPYYINRTTEVDVNQHRWWLSVGYKLMLETTVSAEPGHLSGQTARRTEALARAGRLDGLTISIGPSSAVYLKQSEYNRFEAPYLGDHRLTGVFPEFGIGYYFHNVDVQFNLAYRKTNSTLEAYDHIQSAQRRALTLEGFVFFTDYHGFATFAGLALSREWLDIEDEDELGTPEHAHFSGLKPGFIVGWDIRPNRIQSWYLRTNLRWIPNLDVSMGNGMQILLDQLEINFIQLVIFPGRIFGF